MFNDAECFSEDPSYSECHFAQYLIQSFYTECHSGEYLIHSLYTECRSPQWHCANAILMSTVTPSINLLSIILLCWVSFNFNSIMCCYTIYIGCHSTEWHYAKCNYTECHNAECHSVVLQNVIMLNVILPSVIMLSI